MVAPTSKISKFSPNSVGTGVPDGPKNDGRSKPLPYRQILRKQSNL